MNLRQATNEPSAPSWGSFALVTYLPDPLGSFLTGLRHLLPGEARTEAHITFLPPRPLVQPLAIAEGEIERILRAVQPFEIELGSVRIFPKTGMLYLSVEAGHDELLHLHDLLNCDNLFAEEDFEYIPHITLGHPQPPDEANTVLEHVQQVWVNSALPPRFLATEMVLLCKPGHQSDSDWTRIAAYPLAPISSAARRL